MPVYPVPLPSGFSCTAGLPCTPELLPLITPPQKGGQANTAKGKLSTSVLSQHRASPPEFILFALKAIREVRTKAVKATAAEKKDRKVIKAIRNIYKGVKAVTGVNQATRDVRKDVQMNRYVKKTMRATADVNAADSDGKTVLHLAGQNAPSDVVSFLLSLIWSMTPVAAHRSRRELDVLAVNWIGKTALDDCEDIISSNMYGYTFGEEKLARLRTIRAAPQEEL